MPVPSDSPTKSLELSTTLSASAADDPEITLKMPTASESNSMNSEFQCESCCTGAICSGPLQKRTGFLCKQCSKATHYKCSGFDVYKKDGVLPNAVVAFFERKAVKVSFDDILFCETCSPPDGDLAAEGNSVGDSLNQDIAEKKMQVEAVDLQARQMLKSVQEANGAMRAKLDFLVDFLVPPDQSPVQEAAASETKIAQPSYSATLKTGLSGFQSIVTTACAEAQRQFTESEKMSRSLIYDGVPEGSSEAADASKLFDTLGLSQFRFAEAHRLGVRTGRRPRKLKVVCHSVTDQRFLLSARIQEIMRSDSFPIRDCFVNPSRPSEERRQDFLLRQRRNFLNRDSASEDSYFIHRGEGRLIRKVDGRPDWSWSDDGFDQWLQRFAEEERKARMQRLDRKPKQNYAGGNSQRLSSSGGGWTKVGPNGRPIHPSHYSNQGNG